MNSNAVVVVVVDEWDEKLVEDGETYFMCSGTCNRVMHYEDTNGEGMCGRCEDEDFKANYEENSDESEEEDSDATDEEDEELNEDSDKTDEEKD